MLTPTQEALALLRACRSYQLSLPDGIRRWRRGDEALSGRAVLLAEAAIRDAGGWLALPAPGYWLAYQWSAAVAVAVIALDVRQRAALHQEGEPRPQLAS